MEDVSGFEFRVSSVRMVFPDNLKHETRNSQLRFFSKRRIDE